MSAHSRPDGELSLLEMLADPIIRSEMVRDGATSADLDTPAGTVWAEFAGKWTTKRQGIQPLSGTTRFDQ